MLLCLVVMALLGTAAAPVAATPIADLTALAKYFPDGSPAFVAIRTDDGYIAALDSIASRVIAKLPPGTVPPVSLKLLLDLGSQQVTGKPFADGIRSWLGDSVALGLTSVEGLNTPNAPILVVVDIKDRKAAEAGIDKLLEKASFKKSTAGSLTLYKGSANSVFALSDEALFIVTNEAAIPQGALEKNLTGNAKYTETVGLLPETDYNILIYADIGSIASASMKANASTANNAAMQMQAGLFEAIGAQAYGFTVLDDRSLVIDVASNPGDLSKLTSTGVTMPKLDAVDLKFAANLPANASLVIHAKSIKAFYDYFLQIARVNQPAAQQEQMDKQIEQAKAMVKQSLGLDLDKDIIDWMTGDFAAFVSIDTPTIVNMLETSMTGGSAPTFEKLPFGGGFVAQATDPAKAKAFAAALGKVLPSLAAQNKDVKISQDKIGDVDVTVISQSVPMSPTSKLPLDIVIGANDKVFLMATRAEAEAIFSGKPGLDTTAGFQEAGKYLLKQPYTVFYTDGNGAGGSVIVVGLALLGPAIGRTFNNIVDELSTPTADQKAAREAERKRQEEESKRSIAILKSLGSLFSSSSVSAEFVDPATGKARSRIVLTLAP
jgi:hypothetical protein